MPPPKASPVTAPATEFDGVNDIAELRRLAADLSTEVQRLSSARAEAQLDRDAVARFHAVSLRKLHEARLEVLLSEKDIELASDRHRVEMVMLGQKVRYLEYEHDHNMRETQAASRAVLDATAGEHAQRDMALRADKASLRSQSKALQSSQVEAVRSLKVAHEKSRAKLAEEFEGMLGEVRQKYDDRLSALREELSLRHRVELRDVEERSNSHISQLVRAHEAAYAEAKAYYQGITRANLQLIATLKAQIADAREKAAANGKLMAEIAEENRKLASPLTRATAELNSLRSDLRDVDKDRASLANARGRLASLTTAHTRLQREHTALQEGFEAVQGEVVKLTAHFESSVSSNTAMLRLPSGLRELQRQPLFLPRRSIVASLHDTPISRAGPLRGAARAERGHVTTPVAAYTGSGS